jgi:hypothetical protein
VEIEIEPQPTPDERRAILAALESDPPPQQRSHWWRSGLDDLRDATLQDPGRDTRVVEP